MNDNKLNEVILSDEEISEIEREDRETWDVPTSSKSVFFDDYEDDDGYDPSMYEVPEIKYSSESEIDDFSDFDVLKSNMIFDDEEERSTEKFTEGFFSREPEETDHVDVALKLRKNLDAFAVGKGGQLKIIESQLNEMAAGKYTRGQLSGIFEIGVIKDGRKLPGKEFNGTEVIPHLDKVADSNGRLYVRAIESIQRINEGGKRKNMSQETIDKFIHELCLIPIETPANDKITFNRRQEIINEIQAEITKRNTKGFEKQQKAETKKAEQEAKITASNEQPLGTIVQESLFKKIEESSRSVTNNGIEIGGVKLYCRKSNSKNKSWETNSPYYDLIMEGPAGRRVIDNWCTWTSGSYGGGMGPFASRAQTKYTINTACGYKGGGESVSEKNKTPQLIIWERYGLKDSILKKYGEEYLDVGGDPSILDDWWDKYPFKSNFDEPDEFDD